jgi:hypothetical protein
MSAHSTERNCVPCATMSDILGTGRRPVQIRRGYDGRFYVVDVPDESRLEHARKLVRENSMGTAGSTDGDGGRIRGR